MENLISSTLDECCETLKLGKVTRAEKYYFIIGNMVYCTVYDFRIITKLQEIYGTQYVNYCPYPVLLYSKEVSEPQQEKGILIISRSEKTNTKKAISSVELIQENFTCIETTGLQTQKILETISKFPFIVINGDNRLSIYYIILGSSIPFAIYGKVNKEIRILLEQAGLEVLICQTEKDILEIWENREYIRNTLKDLYNRLFAFITWVPYIKQKNLIKGGVRHNNVPLKHNFRISFNKSEYEGLYIKNSIRSLEKYNSPGGVNFRFQVYNDFLRKQNIFLHPWSGIIEIITVKKAKKLLENTNFRASLSFCLGLIVYSNEIKNIFPDNITISVLNYQIIDNESNFDCTGWFDEQVIVSLEYPSEAVSLVGYENTSRNYICSYDGDIEKAKNRICSIFSRKIPLAVPRSKEIELIIGEDYPLYLDNVSPYNISSIINEDLLQNASDHIKNRVVSVDNFISNVENSAVGLAIKSIFI